MPSAPPYGGALGIVGSASANTLAAEADVVVAVGTRLQDFTTSSWTGFSGDVRIVTVNAARFDAVKHGAQEVVGDAREVLVELDAAWATGSRRPRGPTGPRREGGLGRRDRPAPRRRAHHGRHADLCPGDRCRQRRVRAGRLRAHRVRRHAGQLHGGWRTGKVAPGATSGATMDLEYGFSCMGYEVVAPWGAAMARARTHPDGVVTRSSATAPT